jgi:outer membrane protein assembly factor BamD (BamD/ComL family)
VKTLAFLVIIAALTVAGYYGYTNYQEQILLEQSVARLEQEKQALQAAQANKDIEAINKFITDYPQSDWIEKAIYERDKLAYHQATETNQISALEKFINQYPSSQWITQAQNRLQRLNQEQKLLADIELKQQQLDIQRQQIAEQQANTTGVLEEKTTDTTTQSPATTAGKTSSALSGRERVDRALAIYQKQRQQEQHTDTKQQQEQLKQEQIKKRCLQIKDQIAQYNNRRLKFYDLDGSGNRVYLNKQQVSINRKKIQEEYRQHCE